MKPDRSLYISLLCRDLPRAKAFYAALGFDCDERFTGDQSLCLPLAANIYLMLAGEEQFRQLAPKPPSDPLKHTGVLLSLQCDSKEEVDDFVRKALAAGGTIFEPAEDHGFMYSHSFLDPEGHGFGLHFVY